MDYERHQTVKRRGWIEEGPQMKYREAKMCLLGVDIPMCKGQLRTRDERI